jgi:hypothetical protein
MTELLENLSVKQVVGLTVYGSNGLEAIGVVLDTWVRNRDKPNVLVTGADVGDGDAELFQAGFQLFDGEFLIVQHGSVSFRVVSLR